jgi:hypothetical protein
MADAFEFLYYRRAGTAVAPRTACSLLSFITISHPPAHRCTPRSSPGSRADVPGAPAA